MARNGRANGHGGDAVVVVTPDDLHYPMTMAALDAGLHVRQQSCRYYTYPLAP